MFISKTEGDAAKALVKFWDEHKGAPQQWRNRLVEEFTEEWGDRINLTKPIVRHPDTRRKDHRVQYSVLDVLTDFILASPQVEERKKEYPIQNEQKRLRNESRRNGLEMSLILDEEIPEDQERRPPYSIEEHAFNGADPIADIFFAEPKAKTVGELTALIETVIANAEEYVEKYADNFKAWNTEQPTKKRTAENIRKAIRALDVSRITECRVCGGAFYAHDRRQSICDVQPFPTNKKYSCCQIKNKRKMAENQELAQRNANI